MAVAPSFQKYPTYGDPYEKNGRQYIRIVYPDGHHREVRWYAESPSKATSGEAKVLKRLRTENLKQALGFTNGYITIFKGDTYALLDWFREEPKCRYHNFWGWYVVSTDDLPQIPAGIEPVQLRWEDVSLHDEEALKPESAIKEHLATLLYEPSNSRWQGEVGDKVSLILMVAKTTDIDGYFGSSTFHLFTDEDGNEYTWTTAARKLEVGECYEVRGSIKGHQTYKGKQQTVLTRCRVS